MEMPETPGYRLDQMMSGLHDERIKALYLVGENPAQTEPNAHHVEEGLDKLEFLVSQDLFLNDTSRKHADVVLPASSFAEKDGTFTNTERRVNRVRRAVPCPGQAREDWRIVIDLARELGADWPEYESAEDVWNEFADLSPNWFGIRYDRIEEVGLQWPCLDRDDPGSMYLHSPQPRAAERQGQVLPGRVPAADRAARLRVPVRALDRAHALPLQLGDDDHARGGGRPEAGGPVRRDRTPRTRRRSASPTATGCAWSRAAATSRRARRSASASTRASSGWRSTSRRRR